MTAPAPAAGRLSPLPPRPKPGGTVTQSASQSVRQAAPASQLGSQSVSQSVSQSALLPASQPVSQLCLITHTLMYVVMRFLALTSGGVLTTVLTISQLPAAIRPSQASSCALASFSSASV